VRNASLKNLRHITTANQLDRFATCYDGSIFYTVTRKKKTSTDESVTHDTPGLKHV
jgi:hypothetical protein